MDSIVLKEYENKKARIHLQNNFKYEGVIKKVDLKFIHLLDFKTNSMVILPIDTISQIYLEETGGSEK